MRSSGSDPLRRRCVAVARALLPLPVAPLFEDLPRAFIRRFVAERPALACREDAAGNLLVTVRSRARRAAPLLLVAHMDHPGFRVTRVRGSRLTLRFLGGVAQTHVHVGQRIRLFRRGQAQSLGVAEISEVAGRRGMLARVGARLVSGTAAGSAYAMWDLPAFAVRNGRIVARNCDDGMGCVAALCVLDEIARRRGPRASMGVLFTRAEELGFYGALEAIRLATVPRSATIVSLEASRALPEAPQGGGVIVRVGDRVSTFDPAVTRALQATAARLRRRRPGFRSQRKLMDGGTCEATPFCLAGYRATGVALPLGNYHNQSRSRAGRRGIGAEHVRIADLVDEVRLLVAFASADRRRAQSDAALTRRMEVRSKAARRALAPASP